ncbi:MAG: endonuclease domain-containing protein [Alphaproteobacteria bacterium]
MRLKEHANDAADYDRARILRRNPTEQEQKLWLALRGEAKKSDIKFRRQHVLHPYIVDLACPKARLVVEIDGYSHDLPQNNDCKREEEIKQMGYKVLRFNNEDVDENIEGVVAAILMETQKLIAEAPTPCPRPRGAGESVGEDGS